MVTALEVAGLPVAQLAFEVITQVITSLLTREDEVYADIFDPVLTPFSFH
jgi:hypothetical protein